MPRPRRHAPPSGSDRFGVEITRAELDALTRLVGGLPDADVAAFVARARQFAETCSDPDWMRCCERCGALDVQTSAWVITNTDVIAERDPPFDEAYCPACAAATALTAVHDFYEPSEGAVSPTCSAEDPS